MGSRAQRVTLARVPRNHDGRTEDDGSHPYWPWALEQDTLTWHIRVEGEAVPRPKEGPCVLGDPPGRLKLMHWPALIDRVVAHLRRQLDEPVRWDRGDLVVLSWLRFQRQPGGQWCIWCEPDVVEAVSARTRGWSEFPYRLVWGDCPLDAGVLLQNRLGSMCYEIEEAVALHRPADHRWTDSPCLVWRHYGGRINAGQRSWYRLRERYLQWLERALQQWLAAQPDRDSVEERLQQAIDEVFPRSWRRAVEHRIRAFGPAPRRPSLQTYQRMVIDRIVRPELRAKAPGLLPLFDRMAHTWRGHGEALEWMRLTLTDDVVSPIPPSLWRRLQREGTDWMDGFDRYYRRDSETDMLHWRFENAMDMLQVLRYFGGDRLPPLWLLRTFYLSITNENRPNEEFAERAPIFSPLLWRLGQLCSRAVEQGRHAELDELRRNVQRVFMWFHLARPDRRAVLGMSIAGMVRRTREWTLEQAAAARTDWLWDHGVDLSGVEHPDYCAHVLDSPAVVMLEGLRMRHCAERFIESIERGQYLLFTVRERRTGKAIATAGVRLGGDGGHELHQVAGFANRRVPEDVMGFVMRCVERLGPQWRDYCQRVREEERQDQGGRTGVLP